MSMLHFPLAKKVAIAVVLIAGCLFALPNILSESTRQSLPSFLPKSTVNLGLDLQGGSHLVLAVDLDALLARSLENMQDEIRSVLRDKSEGSIGARNMRAGRDSVSFTTSPQEQAAALARLESNLRDVEITTEGEVIRVQYTQANIEQMRRHAISQTLEILRNRIDEFGVAEPILQQQGDDRIIIELPGVEDPSRAKSVIGRTAQLTFHMVVEGEDPNAYVNRRTPPGTSLLYMEEEVGGEVIRTPVLVERRAAITGERLANASAGFDSRDGSPSVFITFDRAGTRQFSKITTENVGRRMAIVLDDIVYSAPNLREPILGGSAIINGSFAVQQTEDLATVLRAGALPAPVNIVEERTVGPSLGADSIKAGKEAVALGFVFVLIIMLLFYRGFGLAANVALLFNVVLMMAIVTAIGVTLTLPGIAGIVLTIGMAVDANVLIFERIREEARKGSSPAQAFDEGFRSAFATILDANVTTLIAAVVLFGIGSGPVRGFALMLSIGIVCSMFTAILVTRWMMLEWLNRAQPKKLVV